MTDESDRSNYQADVSIKEHRTANATVTILGQDHNPLAYQEIVVAQRSHKFLFGCTGFVGLLLANDMLEGAERVQAEQCNEKLLDLFNFITLPFYWGRFEPERGQPHTRQLINAARWFVDRGCLVKGHPLCWHTVTADWLLDMSNADIIQAQVARIQREVADFAGLIDAWDVINEVVIMPIFDKVDNGITRIAQELGRFGIIRTMFDAARSTNPGATLLLNDFDVSTAYEILIEGCLEVGIQIDAIGIQSHMHQGYWGVEKTLEILECYAKFDLPIHFTENTLVSGRLMPPEIVDLNDYQVDEWPTTPEGEARQAREVVQHYKTLLSHPAVEAITWWGLSDGGWLNAPSGLVRRDCSSKPAYEALLGLVKGEWWLPPTKMVTDGEGRLCFDGFLGEYTMSWAGEERIFRLDEKGTRAVEISF
ncbi:MAG: endo-1,4-beta-xylanase [Anaerolineae bacterium]|nr:endo-1,4-beta-xylanase [Anaerolineae bacterium]